MPSRVWTRRLFQAFALVTLSACSSPGDPSDGVVVDFFPPGGVTTAAGSFAGLKDNALKQALGTAMTQGHRGLGYRSAREAIMGPNGIDVRDGLVECIYTGRTAPARGTQTSGFNIEHSWPQSLGASSEPARSDLHHLFPTDARANSIRSSFPFGEADCTNASSACKPAGGGSELGLGSGGRVFEVRAQARGDIARAKFYFAVRYRKSIGTAEEAVLRAWHVADPPDDVESVRNDVIEAKQGNRNLFVDDPSLVGRISDF